MQLGELVLQDTDTDDRESEERRDSFGCLVRMVIIVSHPPSLATSIYLYHIKFNKFVTLVSY